MTFLSVQSSRDDHSHQHHYHPYQQPPSRQPSPSPLHHRHHPISAAAAAAPVTLTSTTTTSSDSSIGSVTSPLGNGNRTVFGHSQSLELTFAAPLTPRSETSLVDQSSSAPLSPMQAVFYNNASDQSDLREIQLSSTSLPAENTPTGTMLDMPPSNYIANLIAEHLLAHGPAMFGRRSDADCVLIVGTGRYYVHVQMLASRSPTFRRIFDDMIAHNSWGVFDSSSEYNYNSEQYLKPHGILMSDRDEFELDDDADEDDEYDEDYDDGDEDGDGDEDEDDDDNDNGDKADHTRENNEQQKNQQTSFKPQTHQTLSQLSSSLSEADQLSSDNLYQNTLNHTTSNNSNNNSTAAAELASVPTGMLSFTTTTPAAPTVVTAATTASFASSTAQSPLPLYHNIQHLNHQKSFPPRNNNNNNNNNNNHPGTIRETYLWQQHRANRPANRTMDDDNDDDSDDVMSVDQDDCEREDTVTPTMSAPNSLGVNLASRGGGGGGDDDVDETESVNSLSSADAQPELTIQLADPEGCFFHEMLYWIYTNDDARWLKSFTEDNYGHMLQNIMYLNLTTPSVLRLCLEFEHQFPVGHRVRGLVAELNWDSGFDDDEEDDDDGHGSESGSGVSTVIGSPPARTAKATTSTTHGTPTTAATTMPLPIVSMTLSED